MKSKMTISILISLTLFCAIIWLLWINRGDEKIVEVFLQVLIGLSAALLIIIFRFLSPSDVLKKEIQVIQIRDQKRTYNSDLYSKLLKNNAGHQNGYMIFSNIETFDCAAFSNPELNAKFDNEKIGLDILEYAIWKWFAQKYPDNWDIEGYYFEGISGSQSDFGAAKDADKNVTIISFDSLQSLLHDNPIIKDNGQFYQIAFPYKTRVSVIRRDNFERSFRIRNTYLDLTVVLRKIGNTGLEWTILGEAIKKDLNIDSGLYTDNFIIEINADFSRVLRGNPKLLKQKKWIEKTINQISYDFDWRNLKVELERIYKL
jgi:hypothetical protein